MNCGLSSQRLGGVVLAGVAALACLASPAVAQPFEALGTRALGMGGAFVAVADDASAMYWNPAGLATGDLLSLVVERQRLEREGRTDPKAASRDGSVLLALGAWPVGLGYYRLEHLRGVPADTTDPATVGFTDLARLTTSHMAVTVVQTLVTGVTAASSLKVVRGSVSIGSAIAGPSADERLDRAAGLGGEAQTKLDADIGVMAEAGRVRAGLTVRNVREPVFDGPDGSRVDLRRQVRAGGAFVSLDRSTVAAIDIDLTTSDGIDGRERRLALGGERWLGARRVGVRGGVRVSVVGDRRTAGAAGISVTLARRVFADAHVTRGERGADRGWGVALRVSY